MALNRPFVFAAQVVVGAASTNTASFLVGAGQSFDMNEVHADISTAGVNIVGLRDSTGLTYSNCSTLSPVPLAQLMNPARVGHDTPFYFPKQLNLVGQVIFLIDVQNTTGGSVTVNFAFAGFLTVQSAGA